MEKFSFKSIKIVLKNGYSTVWELNNNDIDFIVVKNTLVIRQNGDWLVSYNMENIQEAIVN